MVSKFKEFQGGVERHIDDLVAELRHRGVIVQFFTSEDVLEAGGAVFDSRASGAANQLASGQQLLWNVNARSSFAKSVSDFMPDIVHYHSIYHQLSPSLLGVFKGPQIMTLHDYKLAAPCYTLFRDGEICTECVGKAFATPAIQHRCVGQSSAASFLCSVESLLHRRRYEKEVDLFIVPSKYSLEIMAKAGINKSDLIIVPWGVKQEARTAEVAVSRNPGKVVLFVGRLHVTKGLGIVLDAWRGRRKDLDLKLVIAGAGAMEPEVQDLAAEDSTVVYLGLVDPDSIPSLLRNSDLTLVPSLFPETMGLSALESLVQGTPIISSGRGALGELRGAGVIQLRDMQPSTLMDAIDSLFDDEDAIGQERQRLAQRDLSLYTKGRMVTSIMDQYTMLLKVHSRSV